MRKKIFVLFLVLLLAASGAYAEPLAAGRTFSLDVKNMDIVEVLKIISQEGGFNLFVGGNVRGRVTFFLKDMDVWQAFETLLLSNDLAYEEKDGVVCVMPAKELSTKFGKEYADEREIKVFNPQFADVKVLKDMIAQLLSPVGKVLVNEDVGMLVVTDIPEKLEIIEAIIENSDKPVETRVIDLNYADSLDVSEKLTDLITKNVGKVQVDEDTSKIVITDYRKKLDELEPIIRELDTKPLQVLISAKIVEIQPSKNFYSGVNWDYWLKKYFRVQGDFSIPSPSGTTDVFKMGTIGIDGSDLVKPDQYTNILEFLETFGETKILSSPRIVALHNEEAKILVGTKDVYITSTTSEIGESAVSSQTVNFVDVGVKLYVTPKINQEGYVTLKIKPEISSSTREVIKTDDKDTEIPIVTTSEAETSVIVKDGVTIIIGGLRKDTVVESVKRVPVLGRIPGLNLFLSSKQDSITKNELVILLTPKIISGDREFELELEQKKGFLEAQTDVKVSVDGYDMEDIADMPSQLEKKPENKEKDINDITTEEEQDMPAYYPVFEKTRPERVSEKSGKIPVLPLLMPVFTPAASEPEQEVMVYAPTYEQKISDRISEAASGVAGKVSGSVKVMFEISSDGQLIGEPQVVSLCDNKELITKAVETVRAAAPFEPFDPAESGSRKTYEIIISLNL